MTADAVMRELAGLRALARSLVHGDADADDLLQDAGVAALEHPPELDRPVRPWLAVVLRNRRRMDLRTTARRLTREQAVADDGVAGGPDAALARARTLEKLATALVALEEPYRSTIIKRYLDDRTAADIARADGVPAATVRWRIRTALERLRAALAEQRSDWRAVLAPLAYRGAIVKSKTSIVAAIVALLVLLLGIGAYVFHNRDDGPTPPASPNPNIAAIPKLAPKPLAPDRGAQPVRDPLPGQGRATVERIELAGGTVEGRVINWSTGDGVGGAELTFVGNAKSGGSTGELAGATTVRSRTDGGFELAPAAPGGFTLAAIAAPGFLPFAPELLHSTVHLELAKDRAVRGITIFLFPAVDYHGKVVDKAGKPVAGARVRLLGTPTGEQAIDKLETEWTSAADGTFTFHAADDAVFEATRGAARGWGRLDGGVAISHQLVIAITEQPAHDATITGRVVDPAGKPVGDVLVRASPGRGMEKTPRATAFATTNADGAFALADLDTGTYDLEAQREGAAPAIKDGVAGGTHDVALVLDPGLVIAGRAIDGNKDPVPAYTLLVERRVGAARELVVARSIVDAGGRFEVRVPPGDYDMLAAASGWAPSAPVTTSAGKRDVELALSVGATLRGTVVADADGQPLGYARIMREARSGGASAQPANAGTVTRADGTFELTGIPPGPVSITIGAGGYNPRIEAGMTATDGGELGPLVIRLTKLADGEEPKMELVGIGVALGADGDSLVVQKVFDGGGAQSAGIVAGDHILAVDGKPAAGLGVEGAVSIIRGVAGTTVALTVQHGDDKARVVAVERRKIRA